MLLDGYVALTVPAAELPTTAFGLLKFARLNALNISQRKVILAASLTGKVRWKKSGGTGKGSAAVVAADGELYLQYADGTFVLAHASPLRYEPVSTFTLPHAGDRPSWAHPVVTNGKLFVRVGDHILCYNLRAQ